MASDTVASSSRADPPEVMAAVEDGPTQRLVLADVSREDAFLTLPLEDAASLSAWR